jgi:hypothetical protein
MQTQYGYRQDKLNEKARKRGISVEAYMTYLKHKQRKFRPKKERP